MIKGLSDLKYVFKPFTEIDIDKFSILVHSIKSDNYQLLEYYIAILDNNTNPCNLR